MVVGRARTIGRERLGGGRSRDGAAGRAPAGPFLRLAGVRFAQAASASFFPWPCSLSPPRSPLNLTTTSSSCPPTSAPDSAAAVQASSQSTISYPTPALVGQPAHRRLLPTLPSNWTYSLSSTLSFMTLSLGALGFMAVRPVWDGQSDVDQPQARFEFRSMFLATALLVAVFVLGPSPTFISPIYAR